MQMACDLSVASQYKSATQRARVISENWFEHNSYCFACDEESLVRSRPNSRANDFSCRSCGQRYELKSFQRRPRKSLVDGAYFSLIKQIDSRRAPTLCLLERDELWHIQTMTAIHSSFLVPWVIEQRPPLKDGAKRAGWIGCNIRLDRIPPDGEISVIANGLALSKTDVRQRFQRYLPLSNLSKSRRGWAALTLKVIRSLSKPEFSLRDLYANESAFSAIYPHNLHIREKVRQQLQLLRDLGILQFNGRGHYELVE